MEYLLIVIAFLLGLGIVFITIPPILKVARAKNLFEPVDFRKTHKGTIPPLGGVAIFLGFVLSTIIATDGLSFDPLKYIIAAVILMFFIGLKDDLLVISPRKKLIGQIFAAVILVTLADIRFTNFHGITGLHEIGYITSLIISLFVIIAIINSFNLIDGIDGLASGLAGMAAFIFGIWFILSGHTAMGIMSFALVGSLLGFFAYNVFGGKNKLFMGDSGSLIIGLVISTLVIRFNELNSIKTAPYAIGSAPAVSLAIVIVPLIDTFRVMIIRIIQNRSPFSPDRNHIHHRLLALTGGNHLKSTLIILFVNALIIGTALFYNHISLNINIQFLLIFATGILMAQIPSILLNLKPTKKQTNINLATKKHLSVKK